MAYDKEKLSMMFCNRDGSYKFWVYRSADAIATVRAANYISNALDMGMKVQDTVLVVDTATPTQNICAVISVSATTGAADLSDGVVSSRPTRNRSGLRAALSSSTIPGEPVDLDISPHLLPRSIKMGGGYAHGERFLITDPGVTAQHVVDPNFWVHLAEKLMMHDRIEVLAADGSFDMDLRVVALDPDPQKRWAKVRVLRFWSEDKAVPAATGGGDAPKRKG
jgi:hypothetical protein